MLKAKVFDIAESNMALFGSKVEKNVKLASAESEKAWAHAGKKVGLEIWRIEQFKVVKWPQPKYGQFHTGDSYIILNTYTDKENPNKFKFDVHFWLGTETTQDEAGTAAYKTVELDTLLGDVPVQHREIESKESKLLLSYFADNGGIRILEGGAETGFNHVEPESYKPRLLHLKGKKNVRVIEVSLSADSLNEGDVFILDNGLTLYQWQGKSAGIKEKTRAAQLCRCIDSERNGKPAVEVLDQGDDAPAFWSLLGGQKDVSTITGDDEEWEKNTDKFLFQLTEAGGKTEFNKIGEGARVTKDKLDASHVFLLDAGMQLYIWVGSKAPKSDKEGALAKAQKYLLDAPSRPNFLPMTRLVEGGESEMFNALFSHTASITKSNVSAPAGASMAGGSGCYLTYREASNGSLWINWKHEPVAGALAYFKPSTNVAAFKFKFQGGSEELTRGCDNTAKNLYEGWCNYLKMAKEYKSDCFIYTNDVQLCIQDDSNKLKMQKTSELFQLHTMNTPAVGVWPTKTGQFQNVKDTGRDNFLNEAQRVGSALVLPKNK